VVSDCNDNDELRNRFFALRTKYKLLKKSANTKIEELETELSRYAFAGSLSLRISIR
jgi:hypothetical protein